MLTSVLEGLLFNVIGALVKKFKEKILYWE